MRPFGKYDVPQSEVITRRLGTPALEASYNPTTSQTAVMA